MELKGSQTEKNLMCAFVGESQARNRYTFFASVAKKEGYEQISAIFTETADNEKEHAKRFYKFLGESQVSISGTYESHLGDTMSNLIAAADGNTTNGTTFIASSPTRPTREGFKEIATVFRKIAEVEAHHEARYRALAQNIKDGKVFTKSTSVKWKCRNCGFIFTGDSAPEKCPACAHAKSYFEVLAVNF